MNKRAFLWNRDMLSALLLTVAMAATVLSALGICSEACSEAHQYRLFGFEFWQLGLVYLVLLTIIWFFRSRRGWVLALYDLFLLIGNGMELDFIHVQKNLIGHWCPLCLTIAASLAGLMAVRFYESINPKTTEVRMKKTCMQWLSWGFKKLLVPVFFFVGVCIAVAGVSKAEPPLPDVWLGNGKAVAEVYIISDWFCPHCKKVEPEYPRLLAALTKNSKITFVDLPLHQETFNYMPANISLLLNNKSKYLAGRKALAGLAALKITSPDESLVTKEMIKAGIANFRMADFYSISRVSSSYGTFIRNSGVNTTPSIVVRNAKTGKKKVLVGVDAFREPVIQQAIKEVGA